LNVHADPAASLKSALVETAALTEQTLDALLPAPHGLHARVQAAMRYAIFAGGKRLRPFLTVNSAAVFGAPLAQSLRVAAAIEALHTYSLVHDDLPCMDDDDLRRGQPTTHRRFDEATAVLAGDALLTLAFEILAHPDTHPSAEVRCQLIALLARAGGSEGMIGGQMMDIDAPAHTHGAEEIVLLQRMKTGALFEFCCEAGAVLGGGSDEDRARLRGYARDFGLAFQITDDLIDVTSSAEAAGKQVGKDEAQGKATLVSIHGVAGARREAEALAQSAADAAAFYGDKAELLRALPFYLIGRES